MRTGLFGGSFDPIHLGHTTIADAARRELDLDVVEFIPCRQSPHKAEAAGASAAQRCDMISLATADLPWARLCRVELDREGPSYSWQTAAWFRATQPNASLFWILGADQWEAIGAWAHPDYLASSVTFAVFSRNGAAPAPRPGFKMVPLDARHPASSTAVRETGSPDHLHPDVADYIRDHDLYPRKALTS